VRMNRFFLALWRFFGTVTLLCGASSVASAQEYTSEGLNVWQKQSGQQIQTGQIQTIAAPAGQLQQSRASIRPAATPLFVAVTQGILRENDYGDSPASDRFAASPSAQQVGTTSYERALNCMTMAIAYEAGNQPVAGKEAVAQVIVNRMRTSRRPKSVCGVVFEGSQRSTGCQFTFTCDGSLRRRLRDETITSARDVAYSVLSGRALDRVAGATNYHADYVSPYWAITGTRVTKIGAHIFYRMPGDAASRSLADLATDEPDIALLRSAQLQTQRQAPNPARTAAIGETRSLFAPWGLPMSAAGER